MNSIKYIVLLLIFAQDHQITSAPPPSIQESIADTIKDREVFKLLRSGVHGQQDRLSTSSSEAVMNYNLDKKRERIEKISQCEPLMLYLKAQGCGGVFGTMVTQLPIIIEAIEKDKEEEHMKNTVITLIIQLLSFDDLTPPQRLSHLAILWAFLEDSKLWNFSLIGTKIEQGPISRAVLELSFTKNFDLFAEATQATNSPNTDVAIFPAWLEGLNRVGLLEFLRKEYLKSTEVPIGDQLMTLYDKLIQSSCPLEDNIAKEIAFRCIEIVEVDLNIKNKEWYYYYKILEHIVQFSPASRKILEDSQKSLLKELLERITRWIDLRRDIESFLSSHMVDPYISKLLLPFLGHKPLTLGQYAYIIGVFGVEEGAQNRAQIKLEIGSSSKAHSGGEALADEDEVGWNFEGVPRQDLSHSHVEHYLPEGEELPVYLKDKSFLINILYRASSDIAGAKEFLDCHLQNQDNEYSVKNYEREAIRDPDGKDCALCLSDFFLGQRVVWLQCHGKHTFHYTCWKYFDEKSSRRVICPKCRGDIRTPLRIRQHVFWEGKDTHNRDLTEK